MKPELHSCIFILPRESYGGAINECTEQENGTLWAGNDEYGSQVNYCPYCGYKAKVQVELNK